MKSVGEWLRSVALPAARDDGGPEYVFPEAHRLGGELPLGHLHVWGGPPRAGKTSLLLALLADAARHGRETLLATYDLSARTLALRLLAMASGVPVDEIDGGVLAPEAATAVARARARLERWPMRILEARGCGVQALDWHLVRDPRRVEVLGVDFLQAVVRPAGQPPSGALHDLAALATRRHAAVVVVSHAVADAPTAVEAVDPRAAEEADRVGWVAPAPAQAPGAERPPLGEATLLANRHGGRVSCPLRYDPRTSRFLPPA